MTIPLFVFLHAAPTDMPEIRAWHEEHLEFRYGIWFWGFVEPVMHCDRRSRGQVLDCLCVYKGSVYEEK